MHSLSDTVIAAVVTALGGLLTTILTVFGRDLRRIVSKNRSGGLAHLCTSTPEAAAPFAVFEGCAPRTIRVGILAFILPITNPVRASLSRLFHSPM
jgi:hypothetical protein